MSHRIEHIKDPTHKLPLHVLRCVVSNLENSTNETHIIYRNHFQALLESEEYHMNPEVEQQKEELTRRDDRVQETQDVLYDLFAQEDLSEE